MLFLVLSFLTGEPERGFLRSHTLSQLHEFVAAGGTSGSAVAQAREREKEREDQGTANSVIIDYCSLIFGQIPLITDHTLTHIHRYRQHQVCAHIHVCVYGSTEEGGFFQCR